MANGAQQALRRRSITAILKNGDLPRVGIPPLLFVTSSDAVTDSSPSPPAMGGYMQGYTWYMAIPKEDLQWLHITALELLAACFSIVIFGRLVPRSARLVLQIDATAALATVLDCTETSPALLDVHHAMLNNESYVAISERTSLAHIAGSENIAADAVSRALHDRLNHLAGQLRVRLTGLPLPAE